MKNVEFAVKGKVLTITVDLAQTFGPSRTGKTVIIASTEGNQALKGEGDGAIIGLNVYKKAA